MISDFLLIACVGLLFGGVFGLFTRVHGIHFFEAVSVGLGGSLFTGSLGYLAAPEFTVPGALVTASIGAIFFLGAIWAGAEFLHRQATEI